MNALETFHFHDVEPQPRILVVSDDPVKLVNLSRKLAGCREHPSDVSVLGTPSRLTEMLGRVHPDVVVLASTGTGWMAVQEEMERHSSLPLIFVEENKRPPTAEGIRPEGGTNTLRRRQTTKERAAKNAPSPVLRMGQRSIIEYRAALKDNTLAQAVHDALKRVGETSSMRRIQRSLSSIAG